MNENKEHWGGGISTISQNFPKSPSILFHPLESSISQTSPYFVFSFLKESRRLTIAVGLLSNK
jgi:hypothetical protein